MNSPNVTTETLQHLQPIADLGPESLQQAASLARVSAYSGGTPRLDFPWEQKVVYLLDGELKLDYPDGAMKVLVGGHDEALAPLTRAGSHPIAARAITDIELLWFNENALDILVTWDQLSTPPQAEQSAASLRNVRRLALSTFANLPAAHIESLLASFRRQPVRAGEVIVRQNDPGDYYYVIERGRALVTREVAGANMELAELQAGDTFGEEALIAGNPRNATVTMKTDGDLLRLDNADFIRLLREPLLQRISATEALRRTTAGAVWLDVRFPVEYRDDGLPGAINIPLNELRDALPGLQRDKEYVVYCQTGRRSSAAAFLLSQRGLRASLLDGGLKSMTVPEKVTA